MRSVNIAELKNNLSRYLRRVRAGEEILIRDRNLPVAKIIPIAMPDDIHAEERALAARGLLTLPEEPPTPEFWEAFWATPGANVPEDVAAAAVVADRDEA